MIYCKVKRQWSNKWIKQVIIRLVFLKKHTCDYVSVCKLTAELTQLLCSTDQVTQLTDRSPFDCGVDTAITVVDSKDRK